MTYAAYINLTYVTYANLIYAVYVNFLAPQASRFPKESNHVASSAYPVAAAGLPGQP